MRLCLECQHPLGESETCTKCGTSIDSSDGINLCPQIDAREQNSYDPAFHAELASLEDRNFWFQARSRLIVHLAHKYFSRCAGAILEIGCGTGQVLRALRDAFPKARIYGSDLFISGLKFAQRRVPDAKLMQMDATNIPFADQFDLIGAFDVVEHIPDDLSALAQVHAALTPGGIAMFTVPQHPWLWSRQDELACHARRYRRGELEKKLAVTGFRILYSTSFVTVLLPALMLSRMTRHTSDDPFREVRIGNITNKVLGLAMRLEFQLLRCGLRLPIGGSRLVVARKEILT